MEKQNELVISEEQLDALVQSLLPAMREFFNFDTGKKIWAEHLKNSAGQNK